MAVISIIVPVYNKENYVEHCLNSLCNQTLSDIEIICIDDASSDKSLELITRLSKLDKRIQVIGHEKNMGTLQARKHGVEQATGRYIMFVDSDDWLEAEACSTLFSVMEKEQTDVVQYGTNVIAGPSVSDDMCKWVENFLKPCEERISGRSILKSCFLEDKFDFNITDKIWNAQLCKKAFSKIENIRMIAAEDRYAFVILAYYAKSYLGIPDKYYNYNVGIGITGGDTLDLDRFEKRCSGAGAAEAVKRFLISENALLQYSEEYKQFENKILWDCVDCWHNKLDEKDQGIGYDILLKYWPASMIVGGIARAYFESENDIEKRISHSHIGRDKVAGIYYRYFGYKPMNEYLNSLKKSLERSGYKVVFFTDVDAPIKEIYEKKVILLPASKEANWQDYAERGRQLERTLKEHNVEMMFYFSETSHIAWLDVLLIKTMQINICYLNEKYEIVKNEQIYTQEQKMSTLLSEKSIEYELLRHKIQQLEEQNKKLNEQNKEVEIQNKAIYNSHSYKLGAAILTIPHMILEKIRR